MNKDEKNFQKLLTKHLAEHGIETINLSDLCHPDGKPDTILLGDSKYFYNELKVCDHKRDFMLKTLFTEKQLPYYYKFLTNKDKKLYVTIKMNRSYQVIVMSRKIVKAILEGLKFSDLTKKWFLQEQFFTVKKELIDYIVEKLKD